MALSHSSSADSIGGIHNPGNDDSHNVSQWQEVFPGEEIPFEFEAREKLRHRYISEQCLSLIFVLGRQIVVTNVILMKILGYSSSPAQYVCACYVQLTSCHYFLMQAHS